MQLVYTFEALYNFKESLRLIRKKVSQKKVKEIRHRVFDKADTLIDNPEMGQTEDYLEHLGQGHRRIVENHFKIIYLIKGDLIIITDIFDSRQNPDKMKG